jgi:hypothetical protein
LNEETLGGSFLLFALTDATPEVLMSEEVGFFLFVNIFPPRSRFWAVFLGEGFFSFFFPLFFTGIFFRVGVLAISGNP